MSTGPTIRRHQSRQDFETPWEFIKAVEKRFGNLGWDLAASEDNKKAPKCITESENSLTRSWHQLSSLLYLNPPFNHIEPWAAKCRWEMEQGAPPILFLTPASVGSVWFATHVHRRAMVFSLYPRLSFDGIAPYPKDTILSVFWAGINGFEMWRWK